MSAPSAGHPDTMPRNRRPMIIAAVVVGILVIAVATVVAVVRASDQEEASGIDWSALPIILSCASVPQPAESGRPYVDRPAPDAIRAQTARLEHAGGDRLRIELTMAGPPPPIPELLSIPGYDDYHPVPGSLTFSAALFFDDVAEEEGGYTLSFSRNVYGSGDKQWTVEGNTNDLDGMISVPPRAVDSEVIGDTISFIADLRDFPQLSGGWTMAPNVQVVPFEHGYPSADPGAGLTFPQVQQCSSSTAAPLAPTSAFPSSAAVVPPAGQKLNESDESESGDLFGGTPIDPGACADGGICELSAPSGNYYCTISRTGAFCSPPLGEPLTSGIDDRLITVGSDGETGFLADSGGNSHLEDRQSMQDTTFPYGSTMTAYGMTCEFDGLNGGASCRHDATGHGFTIDSSSYRFF
ncbi:hypothetical protein MTX38_18975 [Rhodococcus sp. ARC_M13]|uniref:hypothetical protein n=1 Tax=unclassified Rhodococcus (in: high G+C Gram-positive bacteria) TaxID=192944 RepID=UPI001FB3A3C6|nr:MULTISPECIES: hypothetical protein [unclassified Rhodococcus (in: high G+C Gram-positive bacteria)]MCJ0899160.1 hypothetical protein [Rhodococcus sp. ARC_M13]MCJ0948956.1 hypothetical protein [Rhodococcus sp. ARC_M8]